MMLRDIEHSGATEVINNRHGVKRSNTILQDWESMEIIVKYRYHSHLTQFHKE